MPAGLNRVCQVIRFSYPVDDQVGGALPTGTTIYKNLDIRIKTEKPTRVLLEQGGLSDKGFDIPTLFTALVFGGNVDINFNDQIEITAPTSDWFYGKKFRVLSVQHSSSHPAQDRNQTSLILKRWGESHSNSIQ